MQIRIRQGRIIDPHNAIDSVTDLFIKDGKIASFDEPPLGFSASKTIDAKGKLILPGLVDLCARLGEPGDEDTATIASESRAAVRSGVTSICCPPDTSPVIDSSAVVELIHQRRHTSAHCKIHCLGALTHALQGKTLANMHVLKEAGCIGISNALAPVSDTAVLRRALEYASSFDMTVHLFCEDESLAETGVVHEGMMSVRLGLPGIPAIAESIAISRVLQLVEDTRCRVHFCRLSSDLSIPMIAEAKLNGLPVTADVDIAHLYLTEVDLAGYDSNCNLRPPLRNHSDRQALRAAVANGIIDAICSDHRPQNIDAKALPFSLAKPGASILDVMMPLALQLAREDAIPLNRIVEAMTIAPAGIAGIQAGTLAVGEPADLTVVDDNEIWSVNAESLLSRGKNNPFFGWEMTGKVNQTFVDGQIVYERDN